MTLDLLFWDSKYNLTTMEFISEEVFYTQVI